MKRSIGVLVCFCIAFLSLSGQNETTKWYFGNTAAVDFMSGAPVTLTNSVMSTGEGSASIAGPGGNLLFYTSGSTIWNANHVAMPNGNGLFGSSISCQSAVIVKRPASANLYYVFTMRNWTDVGSGAYLSIVDMTLASGLGDVTTKNQLVYGNTRESLTAVCHNNGIDYWIVIHDMFTNEFRSYLLTAAGLSAVPVISAVGSVFTGANRYGSLKSSHNGLRLAYALGGIVGVTTEIYNFNRTTGVVSNPLILNNGVYSNAYGVEFSPNDQVLYVCEFNGTTIQQFNLAAGTPALILASNTNIATGANVKSNLQSGPDGRIYVGLAYQSQLAVINTPNNLGAGSGFVNLSQNLLGRTCGLGLPNFMPCLVPVILPAEWAYWRIQPLSDAIQLQWSIAETDHLSGFVVERRSLEDADFHEVGNVVATPSGTQAFEWSDKAPQNGWNEYRIAVISENGEIQYSNILGADWGHSPMEVQVFPNPISHNGCWNVDVKHGQDAMQVEIIDLNGKSIYQTSASTPNTSLPTSLTQFSICLPDLRSGVYVMQVKSPTGILASQKLLKQ